MKLMMCIRCWDVVKFQFPGHDIWCECKRSRGHLHDHIRVSVWGPSIILGINNLDLKYSLQIKEIDKRCGVSVHSFIVSDDSPSITRETYDGQRSNYDEASHKANIERQLGIGEDVS